MFLKSLEVRGFKSFADKTDLKFKEGITAVVGPNGSGKSNISDAVRWVLGEQSIKTLRGGKMEDVIFAGTQFRKPVGLAQVSLTLDNSDGALATDYSEVRVSRRIFRSGETEYLINNQKCRLKDITQLFMDTGIGKEGYSLIGQGKIEAILSGKPEERRALLEEAAGIVKYKSRKIEAEKKLDNTENNLVRIRDIISTYEERIEPLKKEREKALKYKEIAEELKVKEVSLIVKNIKKVESDLALLVEEIRNREKAIEEKKMKLAEDKEKQTSLEKQLEELERKNNTEKEEFYNKKETTSSCQNDIVLFKERINNLKVNIEKNILEIKELEEKTIRDESEKVDITNKLNLKRLEKANLDSNIEELDNSIGELSKQIQDMTAEYKTLTEQEFEILKSSSNLNNEIAGFKKDTSNKLEYKESLSKSLETTETNIGINKATIEGLLNNIEEKKKELRELNEKIRNDKNNLSNLRGDLNKKDLLIKDSNRNINKLEANYNMLSELEKHYEGYNRSVKILMERIEKNEIPYGKGTTVLGEIFEVKKEYEVAIEIALGASISNIITETEDVAKRLIQYLKTNHIGRATFLPRNIIKGRKISVSNDVMNIRGFVGIASDIISYDGKYKEIIEYSLGRTLVATDMDSAFEISRRGNHSFRIVTLTGEIINPGGALTGGSIQGKHTNILGRKRELEDINESLNRNREKLKEEVKEFESIKTQIALLDEEILNKRDIIHNSNIDITKLQGEVNSLNNDNMKLKKSLELAKSELITIENQIDRINREIQNREERVLTLTTKNSSNKERVEFLNNEIELGNEKINELRDKVTHIKISKATTEESVNSMVFEVNRKDREISEIKSKIQSIGETNTQNNESIVYIESQIEIKQKLIDDLRVDIEALEVQFKEDEVKKIKLKEEQKAIDGLINELVEIIRKDENDLNKREIQNAKAESERDSYYKKLNEELTLTLAEAEEITIEIENLSLIKEEISTLKGRITRLGTVNLAAIAEYEEVCEKYEFMSSQEQDLENAKKELLAVIDEMTGKMQELFKVNFEILNRNFNETFNELFKGGTAQLILGEGDELTANIEINVQPPGKKLQNINLMSGGEKVLSAIALMFAILKMKPTPFCILDEIEAALDDANVYRYAEFLKEFSDNSQFIVITHRKGTMEAADVMYGVTMEEKGVSKVVSVDLSDSI